MIRISHPRTAQSVARLLSACAFFFTLLAGAGEPEDQKPLLTILFTGEAHAALLPCDCPLQPLGGVARRAAMVKRYRERGPVLLVDAGGWVAGGMYDEDSDGDPARDRLRTELMARAMKLMKYDVVTLGRDDIQMRGDALISPVPVVWNSGKNPLLHTAKLIVRPWGWAEAGANRPEAGDGKVPAEWNLETSYFELHLSRLGEDESEALARKTRPHLLINAGRKASTRLAWTLGETTLANFDYQAQRLGVAEIFGSKTKGSYAIRVRQEVLGPDVPDDPEVAALLSPHLETLKKKGKQRVDVEFWTMPECLGCEQARAGVQRMAQDLSGRVKVSLHFVVNRDGGKWSSLHGERELKEARAQAVIQKYYPEKIWDWLSWRHENVDAPWEDGAKKLGLLAARLRGALAVGEADELLQADMELAQRRRVNGTPTLAVANRLYDGPLERPHVMRALCSILEDPKPAACRDVPACFFDAQCRKRGYIGRCLDAGTAAARCDASRPALKVAATILVDRENLHDNHERIVEVLIGDLPGIEFTVLDIVEPAAKQLIEKSGLPRVPAYLLDPIAKNEHQFDEGVGRVARLDEKLNRLVLPPYSVGAHRLLDRPRKIGRADLFVSRFSKAGQEALETALEFSREGGPGGPQIELHDALYWKESADPTKRELAASGGLAEIEEAARAQAVRRVAPDRLNGYFMERGKQRGSSYWDVALKAAGVDAEKVRALAEGPAGEILLALHAEADFLKSLDAGGEITLLAENCELIPIRSRQDLRQTLEKIAQRRRERPAPPAK